ncbi:hypothetical protein C4J93_0057 [Pseudomonas sp. R2-37-08W]|nr:hypothetical protein C4J93_0057 [Pseudomonas sp. R2-37-08W]
MTDESAPWAVEVSQLFHCPDVELAWNTYPALIKRMNHE